MDMSTSDMTEPAAFAQIAGRDASQQVYMVCNILNLIVDCSAESMGFRAQADRT